MALISKELGVLPEAGGLMDQHPLVVMLMTDAISAINERQELEQKRAKANQR